MVFRDGMSTEIDAVVELHQRDIEVAFFGGFVGLQFGLELFVGFDPLRGVAAGFDQSFGVIALTVVAFAKGFENIHGGSSSTAFEMTL
jgi:hypothetical protein